MKEYTTTDIRRDSPKVYNSVQKDGAVMITHRDRPTMFLMTSEQLEKLKNKKTA